MKTKVVLQTVTDWWLADVCMFGRTYQIHAFYMCMLAWVYETKFLFRASYVLYIYFHDILYRAGNTWHMKVLMCNKNTNKNMIFNWWQLDLRQRNLRYNLLPWTIHVNCRVAMRDSFFSIYTQPDAAWIWNLNTFCPGVPSAPQIAPCDKALRLVCIIFGCSSLNIYIDNHTIYCWLKLG